MYTKVTNSHIRLRGQTLLISPLMMTMLLLLLSLATMGRAEGEERKRRERERERWRKRSRDKANVSGSMCGLFGIPLIFDFIQPCSC